MDIANFTFTDGLMVSLFGTVIVFLILILLLVVVTLFRYLPKEKEKVAPTPSGRGRKTREDASQAIGTVPEDDEDALVAMLTASILAKEDYPGDVRIKSIKRIHEEG